MSFVLFYIYITCHIFEESFFFDIITELQQLHQVPQSSCFVLQKKKKKKIDFTFRWKRVEQPGFKPPTLQSVHDLL